MRTCIKALGRLRTTSVQKEHGIHPGTQFLQPRRGILQLNGGDGERHRVFLGEMFPKRSQNSGVSPPPPFPHYILSKEAGGAPWFSGIT